MAKETTKQERDQLSKFTDSGTGQDTYFTVSPPEGEGDEDEAGS